MVLFYILFFCYLNINNSQNSVVNALKTVAHDHTTTARVNKITLKIYNIKRKGEKEDGVRTKNNRFYFYKNLLFLSNLLYLSAKQPIGNDRRRVVKEKAGPTRRP